MAVVAVKMPSRANFDKPIRAAWGVGTTSANSRGPPPLPHAERGLHELNK